MLQKIITGNSGRQAQLQLTQQKNIFARASDVNPIIDAVNGMGGDDLVTASGSNTPTINNSTGKIVTASLTTAAATAATITLTNSVIKSTSNVVAWIENYSGTLVSNGIPVLVKVVPSTGSVALTFVNIHASNALNGTLTIRFIVLN